MISVENVSKKFGKQQVLENISFKAEPGEVFGLIGYNGVGKTTLMKIISGIYRPDGGNVLMDGATVYENPDVKRHCFFMTEESAWFEQSSLNEMRKFYKGYYDSFDDKIFYGLSEFFSLDTSLKINSFSKGMQRQAALTSAFSVNADYLILDEAFDGLDVTMRNEVTEMIKYYAKSRNASVIVSSHNLTEMEKLADSIGLLNEGKLEYSGPVGEILSEYRTLEEFFAAERKNIKTDWRSFFEK